jgi:hypothetical protein
MNPPGDGRRPTEVASPPIELVGVTPSRTRSGRSASDYHVPELPLMNPLDDGRRPTEVASPPIELVGVTPSRTRPETVGVRLSRVGVTPSRTRPETVGARQRWRIAVR